LVFMQFHKNSRAAPLRAPSSKGAVFINIQPLQKYSSESPIANTKKFFPKITKNLLTNLLIYDIISVLRKETTRER
jgi:hypothetical protein